MGGFQETLSRVRPAIGQPDIAALPPPEGPGLALSRWS